MTLKTGLLSAATFSIMTPMAAPEPVVDTSPLENPSIIGGTKRRPLDLNKPGAQRHLRKQLRRAELNRS